MKTFDDYVKFQEIAAYDVGNSVLGRTSLDDQSESALKAAMQAFEVIMSRNSSSAIQFLNRMTESMPELKAILQQAGLDSFRDSDFRTHMKKAASKGRSVVTKGLGDFNQNDMQSSGDVVTPPSADTMS